MVKSIENIKEELKRNIGQRIMICVVKGRKRYSINSCTIENAYNGIFVVKTVDSHTNKEKYISFSYCDILTGTIKLKLYKDANVS